MRLIITSEFKEAFKGLSKDKQKSVERTITKLGAEQMPPSLKIRPLKSSNGRWIANVGSAGYRIIFAQPVKGTAELLDVGAHDATYRKWNRRKL